MRQNVYQRAREVVQALGPVVAQVRAHDSDLANQMKRAAQSVVLNIAEARGSYRGNAKTRFGTACGSAKEVRAALSLAAREPPSHRADFVEKSVDLGGAVRVDVTPGCCGRQSRTNLFGGTASAGEPGLAGPGVIALTFGDVENDAVHRPSKLARKVVVTATNRMSKRLNLGHGLKCTGLNDHERNSWF